MMTGKLVIVNGENNAVKYRAVMEPKLLDPANDLNGAQ